MSSTTTQQVCHCSCGRAFVHEASLTRHCFVSGHEPARSEAALVQVEDQPTSDDCSEVYARALAILEAKIEEQRAFDQELAKRGAAEQAEWLPPVPSNPGPTLADMKGAVEAVACATRTATRTATSHLVAGLRLALNLVAMLLLFSCLLASGVKIGGMLADSNAAPEAGSPVRQLVGARG